MHRRIVFAVSVVLVALLAAAAGIVADLQDRDYPVRLGAKSLVSLDFSESGISDAEAFRQLGMLSDRLGIGLVKVAPDLGGDQSGQVFVAVGARDSFPATIRRFGDQPDAQIRGNPAMAQSYASGRYLVTGETTRLAEFKAWLTAHGVSGRWNDDSLGDRLLRLVIQRSFGTSLLAAAVCNVVAAVYVGLSHGWVFVPYYARELLTFDAIVIVTTMVCAVAMSVASLPSARMLAAGEPAVKSLRTTSVILKVAPAFATYTDARASATEQAHWKSLADHVALSFDAGMGETGFQQLMSSVGDVVNDAEERNAVALSYTWTDELVNGNLEPDENVSLVNQRWLDLTLDEGRAGGNRGGQGKPGLTPLPRHQVPEGVSQLLGAHLELWSRDDLTAAEALGNVSFFRSSGSAEIPMALGGDLVFSNDAIVVVAPRVHDMFNDDFLASAASTRNLVFMGLGPTQELVARHGLQNKVYVKYVAEEGVLRAQLAASVAWLQGISLVALVVALIGAFITAVLKARRDFPLRLAGKRWMEILADLVAREWSVGVALIGLVILVRGVEGGVVVVVVAVVAVAGLLLSPLTHLLAARWAFARVSLRGL